MRAARSCSPFLLVVAAACAGPWAGAVLAQDCDYQIVQAWWSPHPSPDSIYVNFIADVVAPVSADPLNPSHYDMDIAIHFNGAPMVPEQEMTLLRWSTPNACGGSCPSVVCRHEEWSFKNVPIIQESRCTRDAQNVCGCPPLGTPVAHEKPVKKPPSPGIIDVEIIPLGLQSCNPIRPDNDQKQFPYPGTQQQVPGLPGPGLTALVVLLVGLGASAARRRRRGPAHGGSGA